MLPVSKHKCHLNAASLLCLFLGSCEVLRIKYVLTKMTLKKLYLCLQFSEVTPLAGLS